MDKLDRLNELKSLFKRRINQKIKRLKKRVINIEINLEKFKKRDEYILKGELLKMHLKEMRKGMDRVVYPNIFSSDSEDIEIKLDSKLGPVENMKYYFKQERKMKKGAEIESERLIQASKEAAKLTRALERFLVIEELEDAEVIFRKHFGEPVAEKIVQKRLKKKLGKRYPYHGAVYVVGRKAKENDEIVKKVAHGNDWWFHIRDYTGSHVILILPKGQEINGDFIQTGALIALVNSKAKNSLKEEVIYTQVKNLKKIPGRPGLFSYSSAKSIVAVQDAEKRKKLEEMREFQKI